MIPPELDFRKVMLTKLRVLRGSRNVSATSLHQARDSTSLNWERATGGGEPIDKGHRSRINTSRLQGGRKEAEERTGDGRVVVKTAGRRGHHSGHSSDNKDDTRCVPVESVMLPGCPERRVGSRAGAQQLISLTYNDRGHL